ncbi:MAG: RDD family protein [Helicobacter sp.]|nr:RDD family protein [Helicobacter sp.]
MEPSKIQEILFREDLKIASFWKRFGAFLLDDFLLSLVLFLIFYSRFASANDMEAILSTASDLALYVVILRFIYHAGFTFFYGASIGKMIFGIKIISLKTLDRPDLLDSLVRSFFKELGGNLFYVTYFFAIGDTFMRTLHDRIVKSIVIDIRG